MENIKHFFEFLQTKENKKLGLRLKLILGLKVFPAELKVDGDLDLSYSKITSLPEGLKVGGYLDLSYSSITSLPEGLKVGGSIYVSDEKINYFRSKFPNFADKIKK